MVWSEQAVAGEQGPWHLPGRAMGTSGSREGQAVAHGSDERVMKNQRWPQ